MEQLGINWGLLIAQLVNVALTIWILTIFLYRPILNMLNERTRRIQEGLRDAEQVKEQLASAKQDYDAELARGRQEAANIIAQAQERAKAQEQELIAQARQEADRIRQEARDQSLQERDQLLRDIKDQMADLVTTTAARVLGEELKANHDKLITESLAELGRRN
ncbi:MAG: F0F1 ATP synthase subunit B [Chloroflexi bacterium AL-W]|nr:F0F1 ATP synthase subunit B [Chloroflexi bacterium AL-N1]NOK64968.1 F0F1 ATP synthase subunit B [Chloroflexi bacterium AL-N10]NOK76738.1 F0F1 ATP synthase subunit B [Chloroflexi bacterium AL-N5]NOK84629.1 F0F1 ATP synthase subunit B [Chloroflexi bacterium AL-W]NOK86546.1 F0F1 ATP synthase subunit B [Chloroflexi bacterium AL-N15]